MRCTSLVSGLIFFAVVLSLGSSPAANDQTLTTITSLQTITTETAVTRLSVSTAQSIGYATLTTTQFTTSTLAQPRRLLVYQHVFSAVPEEYGCIFDSRSFTAQEGQVVAGTISSDYEVSVYLMSQHDYDVWRRERFCSAREATLLIDEVVMGTYSFELVIPSSGRYQFVFLNYSHEDGPKVNMNADIVGSAAESSVIVTRTYTQQSYSTESAVVSTVVTQTVTSRRTEQVAGIGFAMEGSSMLLMAAGVVVGLVVVGLLFVLRGRRPKAAAGAVTYEPEAEVAPAPPGAPPPGMKFCVHCGAKIPNVATFCTKCGTKQ